MADNINRWRAENEDWFDIEQIPDDLLPKNVFNAIGGSQRRRSSFSFKEPNIRERSVIERGAGATRSRREPQCKKDSQAKVHPSAAAAS